MKSLNNDDRKLIEEFSLFKTPGKLRKLARINKLHIGHTSSMTGTRTPDFMLRAEKINSSLSPRVDDIDFKPTNVPKLPVLMTRSISFSKNGLRPVTSPFPYNPSPSKKDGLADLEHLRVPS